MSQLGKKIRLNRLLRADRCTLVVAFDHALVLGTIAGTQDPGHQIRQFAEGKADAILLNLGMFQHCAELPARGSMPALIARLDWTTAFSDAGKMDAATFRSCLVAQPEQALRLGADAVITYLVVGSGNGEFERGEIVRTAEVARECEGLGVPLIVESIARGPAVQNPVDPRWLMKHTRMAAELGADVIKTEYTGDPNTMQEVVKSCPIPILVLGGSRLNSDDEVVNVTRGIVQSGAAGVFFGRNIFQAENIPNLLQKIHAVLRDNSPS